MKKTMFIFAALVAASLFADSMVATKTYVDRKYNEAISNSVQKETIKIEIGSGATAKANGGISIGADANESMLSGIAIGGYAKSQGMYGIALGLQSETTNSTGVSIGYKAKSNQSSVSLGTSTESSNAGVALGPTAKATGQYGVALGYGAVASGNQSFAIGRDAKATHVAAGAIGPMAETTADSTLRVKYAPSEIYIGFWQPKSLQAYFDELTPNIDYRGITNLVNSAPYLPKTVYGKYYSSTVNLGGWNITSNGTALTSTWEFKGAGSAKPTMVIGSGAKLQIGYGSLDATSSGSVYLRNPNRVYVGANGTTNLTDFIASIGGSGGVTEGRVGEIATNVVRECSLGGIWDATLQVWWTPVMANGKLTYQATTNVNMNATQYTNWSTDNLPSGVTWDAQPTYDASIDLWNWGYGGGSEGALSEEGGADATSLTFGYGEGFTSTRSVIQ